MVLPEQLRNGRVRRPHRDSAPGGRGIPSERRTPRRKGAVSWPEVSVSEAGVHASGGGADSAGRDGDDTVPDEGVAGRDGPGGDYVVCGDGEDVAAAGAVQGEGGVY